MLQLAAKSNLWWLIALPLVFLWQRWIARRGRRHIWFTSRDLFPVTGKKSIFALLRSLRYVKLAAFGLLLLALSRPQLVNRYKVEETRGVDILLTLDISGSMAAVDFRPKNRLEVAKDVISRFIVQRKTDRIGLVAFAATSITKCPLTVDHEMVMAALGESAIGDLEDGTAIGMALATSLTRIRKSQAKTKLIILLTDGNNNRGEIDPRDAARMARDYGIKVYTIGVGTQGEAPFPYVDSFGRQRYVMAQVEIDEALLKEMAQTTGGLYFRAIDRDSLQRIFSDIDRWEKSRVTFRIQSEKKELFPLCIGLGFILLALVEVSRRTFLRTLP